MFFLFLKRLVNDTLTETTLNMFVVLHFLGRKDLPTKTMFPLFWRCFFASVLGLVASGLVLLMLCCLWAKSLGTATWHDISSGMMAWGELVSKNVLRRGGHEYTSTTLNIVFQPTHHPNWGDAGRSIPSNLRSVQNMYKPYSSSGPTNQVLVYHP